MCSYSFSTITVHALVAQAMQLVLVLVLQECQLAIACAQCSCRPAMFHCACMPGYGCSCSNMGTDGNCAVLVQALSSDNERLRLSASAARETSARQADELKRLQRDNARMSSALVRPCLHLHSTPCALCHLHII